MWYNNLKIRALIFGELARCRLTLHRQSRQNNHKSDKMMKRKIKLESPPTSVDIEGGAGIPPVLDLRKMITREKVAEYLNVSIQTVINYTNKGWLVAHKIGRRVLYNEDEVIGAIQNNGVKRYQHESTRTYIFSK